MRQHEASRTLVKSPPELWAECSDASSLARHLDQFGDIRITKLEPETAVAWEGERGSGTVRIEPSGWGTKVILTAVWSLEEAHADPVAVGQPAEPEPADAEPELEPADAEPESESADAEPESEAALPAASAEVVQAPARRRRFARLLGFLRGPEPVVDEATPGPEPRPEAVPVPADEPPPTPATEAALCAALDSLGQAHHRPYSRG